MEKALLEEIQAKVKDRDYRFTLHAGDRMTERHIAVKEVEEVLLSESAELIEDYAEDPRSPSCLILGITKTVDHYTYSAPTHPMSRL